MTEAGWTRKKPTAAGFYWFKYDFTYIVEIVDVDGKLEVWFHGNEMQSPITYLDGEWLGPISPDDRQQGRVEGLREAAKTVRDRAELLKPSLGLWLNMVNKHKSDEADELAYTIEQLAQQAQDEKGVWDGAE